MKNWKGSKGSLYRTLGASNHVEHERASHDFYATDPIAARLLLELEDFDDILEPAAGMCHLANEFRRLGKNVTAYDIVDRGCCDVMDFFDIEEWNGDIITNPPYRYAQEFVEHSLDIVPEGRKVAMFLKIQFLEGKRRKRMFMENPPRTVYVSSSRILCAMNADFEGFRKGGGSAAAYCWFVWVKGYDGKTTVEWFN